jgi:hypothetical protein
MALASALSSKDRHLIAAQLRRAPGNAFNHLRTPEAESIRLTTEESIEIIENAEENSHVL